MALAERIAIVMSTCPSADTSRGTPWLTGVPDGSSRVANSLYHVMVRARKGYSSSRRQLKNELANGFRNGDPVNIRAGLLSIGSASTCCIVDCRAAPRWLPTRHSEIEPGLAGRLAVVATAASGRSWHESARMAQSVRSALECPVALGDVAAKVVGRGPGSTPSGDDVLVGILAVLSSPSSGAAGAMVAESLGRAILPLLWTTSDVSGQLLRQAIKGLFSRDVHELVLALLGNPAPEQFLNLIRRVIETGATSGADTCMGLLAVAPYFFIPREKRAAT